MTTDDSVRYALYKEGIYFESTLDNEEETIFVLKVRLITETMDVIVHAKKESKTVIIYVPSPLKVTKDYWASVIEYMARINLRMPLGNFEFNASSGLFRFKSAYVFEERHSEVVFIDNLYHSCNMMAKYSQGLFSICNNQASAESALKQIDDNQP